MEGGVDAAAAEPPPPYVVATAASPAADTSADKPPPHGHPDIPAAVDAGVIKTHLELAHVTAASALSPSSPAAAAAAAASGDPVPPARSVAAALLSPQAVSLVCLVLQNSSLPLMMRLSRTHVSVDGPYLASTAVVCAEALKLVACCAVLFLEHECNVRLWVTALYGHVAGDGHTMMLLAVPSMLYTFQNNLQYVAISHLETATYQVNSQLKILTTGVFSVVLLHRQLTPQQWASMVLLTVGVALVQLNPEEARGPPSGNPVGAGEAPQPGAQYYQHGDTALGLFAVLAACSLSGLAGVYFESILKGSEVSVWMRNIQLGLFGALIGLVGVVVKDGAAIAEHGFFYGYTWITWLAIANQALGGLLVALVVKYADNILKGYATSLSIIMSSVLSIWLFDFELSWLFGIGTALVISAVYMYS